MYKFGGFTVDTQTHALRELRGWNLKDASNFIDTKPLVNGLALEPQ